MMQSVTLPFLLCVSWQLHLQHIFLLCRTGESRGTGEEEDLPYHHQGLPTIFRRRVSDPAGDESDGTRRRDSLQPQRPVSSGLLP